MSVLAEVFSVTVGLDEQQCAPLSCTVRDAGTLEVIGPHQKQIDENPLKLCGTIHVRDGYGSQHFLYDREAENPELVCPFKDTIAVIGPSKSLLAVGLEIKVNLRDSDRGIEISRGWIGYFVNYPKAHLSKRLCAVVQGQHGFANVYYMLLPGAAEAVIEADLLIDARNNINRSSPSSTLVFGSLVGSYGGHDYSVEYQKKYYRTVFFRESSKTPLSLTENSKRLPLSRSVIAVPKNTSLVIESELFEKLGETDEVGLVNNSIEFPWQVSGCSSKEIQGKNGRLTVTVTWRLR